MVENILPASLQNFALQAEEAEKGKNKVDQNEFLELMITQLKNQNPLDPADSTEFLSQLAQITTATGIEDLKSSFDQFSAILQSSQALEASTLVGRSVMVEGNVFTIGNTNNTTGVVALEGSSDQVTVSITDASGQLIRDINLGQQEGGFVNFTWNGLDNEGNQVKDGTYIFSATAMFGQDPVAQATTIVGNVESVTLTQASEGPLLNLENLGSINLNEVIKIM